MYRSYFEHIVTKTCLLIGALTIIVGTSISQEDFYDITQVREVKIYFSQDDWKYQLDSLFSSGDSYTRIQADVEIDGEMYPDCGVRYKGFSSWNADEAKNPFNISLDYTYANQNHQGYRKLKLSNVIYDPSFVREVLSYSIARKYMPASGSNFANLYINDTLIGVYTNNQAVDDGFVETHFGNSDNSFFKGNPESLQYPFGQNANLAYAHGDDSSGYEPYYKIESDNGWKELFNFIDVLNNDTANIEQVLNVDRALWMHAFNYSLLNLDSYIAYSQNYYLYQENNAQFNTIIWDLNMSFGSFRHSDGSTNFSGLTISKLETLDPLQHLTFSISPRPLMKNLFLNSTYKKMYLAHIRTIISENITNGDYLLVGEQLQELIDPYVQNDTNKFYTYLDFTENLSTTVGESTEQYAGLQALMEPRVEYLNSYYGMSGYPIFSSVETSDDVAVRNESITLNVEVELAEKVSLFYRFNDENCFASVSMSDDSESGVYSASIVPEGKILEYYFWAENDSSGTFLPARAAYEFYSIPVKTELGEVVINEIQFQSWIVEDIETLSDFYWVELYNPSNEKVHLTSLELLYNNSFAYLTDTFIQPYGYYLVSLDDFYFAWDNLVDRNNSTIYLTDNNGNNIDTVSVSFCSVDRSLGCYPDGMNQIKVLYPSPGSANNLSENEISPLSVYPNPVVDEVIFNINANFVIEELIICNSMAQVIYTENNIGNKYFSVEIDTELWPSGVYYIRFSGDDNQYSAKFVK